MKNNLLIRQKSISIIKDNNSVVLKNKKMLINTEVGFSIELIENFLELRGEHEGLPLYESIGGKITAIAIVNNPAIEINAVADNENQTVAGPVMRPDIKILRNAGLNGQENCYWYFSAETIEKLKNTFTGKIKFGH